MPESPDHVEPIDPDVDLRDPGQRREWTSHRWVLPVIALGGIAGATARHALELLWPATPGAIPWATLVTNVGGSLLIGVLMVYVVEVGGSHPLLRPFAGVGVLGGFTTFSTYAVQSRDLWAEEPLVSLAYVLTTPLLTVIGVFVGHAIARTLWRPEREPETVG